MRYLLDTNVCSDGTKPRPDPVCQAWLKQHGSECVISTVSLAEMRYGIERLPEGKRRRQLHRLLDFFVQDFRDAILDFDETAAAEYGRYLARIESECGLQAAETADVRDVQIAAIAQSRGCTVVTRNTSHFPFLRPVNPFQT